MVVIFEDGYGEFVLAQVAPDIFHRIEFRGIGRQAEQGHVVGGLYVGGEVIARAVGDEDGMGVRSDLLANFGKMQGESFGVGLWLALMKSDALDPIIGASSALMLGIRVFQAFGHDRVVHHVSMRLPNSNLRPPRL